MARRKTNKVHFDKNGVKHEVSREIGTDKMFIKNTNIEVTGKVTSRKNNSVPKGYDFSKPFMAQDLGDEWDDYAWSGDDF